MIMDHVLQTVFDLPPDSDLEKILSHNGYRQPTDFVIEKDETLDGLAYPNDAKAMVKIKKGDAGLLKSFKRYVAFQAQQGTPFDIDDWVNITPDQFDKFWSTNTNMFLSVAIPAPTPPARQPYATDIVKDFKRGIKRNIGQFPSLKDDNTWDNWNRSTVAQARAQDIIEVLDPTYIPSTADDIQLFEEKQKFMYAVFEKTLLTDKGKALVRQNQQSFNAQQIYKELSAYAMQSTKATMTASSLLSYITSTNLGDGKWKGSTHAFILHWQDQIQKYHNLNPQQALSSDLQCTLLQNAVYPIAELWQVKLQAAQFKTQTGKDLSYNKHCSLLVSAAQQYDSQNAGKTSNMTKRRIYQHDLFPDHDHDNTYDTGNFDIDQPLDLIQVHATNFGNGPRLSYKQWHVTEYNQFQLVTWTTSFNKKRVVSTTIWWGR